jgi:uncharacterized membrane protein YfcA
MALAGTGVALIAAWASHRRKPYAWNMGFVAIAIASLGTALGLWKLAGESGWEFLGLALFITLIAVALALAWGRYRPITPVQEAQVSHDEKDRTKRKSSWPRPQ